MRKIYILPHIINSRMLFPEIIETCRNYQKTILNKGKLYIESVAFQATLPQLLRREGRYVEEVQVRGDKRSRLAITSPLIQNGTILFPRKGAEELIQQLVGFGVEKHDDLVDAFTLLVHKLIEEDDRPRPNLHILCDGEWSSAINYDDEWDD